MMYRVEILKGRKRPWWGVVCQNNEAECNRAAILATRYNRRGRWLRFGRVDDQGRNFQEIKRWRARGNADQ